MSANLEDSLVDRVRALPPDKQREVLIFLDKLTDETKAKTGEQRSASRPLWEVIADTNAELPPNTWDDVPTDASLNLDHYLYGAPKRKS
jgi:hypothetical protein